jgi:hypothetical protein
MVRCRDELAGIDANDIYRHVICRQLSGINSTGLRDDVYDAVVMVGVGGFGDHPATVLGEMIRITKPGMNRSQRQHVFILSNKQFEISVIAKLY